ncbi:unnamed protein product [Rhizoctonia solani]|uniref:Homologous-pairing protein 2 winged helix domain-containing protein n=1 Tax=Rhizoctonia solani TaxID=456999 RepID=A0A8H2X3A4_9AGAM|nr:unnamed protein product [Rhizoctonia solani]
MVPEKEKTPQLKGKDAEDAVLKYLKKTVWIMFVSRALFDELLTWTIADISANLKNAVTKAATQKILLSLAEKELVTQKTYGKATYFVAPQTTAETLAPSEIDALTSELEKTKERVKELSADAKRLTGELGKVKASPTDDELGRMVEESEEQIQLATRTLAPLRTGQAPISESDLARLDADWIRWRTEWVTRKKVFKMLWDIRSDSLSSSEAAALLEDLGIEQDTPEHTELEKSELCTKFKSKK